MRTETGKVFDDWVWFDEGDAVNVIVNGNDSPVFAARRRERDGRRRSNEAASPSQGGAGKLDSTRWIVFNQTK